MPCACIRPLRSRLGPAIGLGWTEIAQFLKTTSRAETFSAARDRALLCVAYDLMARRSELVALNVEDLHFLDDGTGRALIRRSKTDQAGEGSVGYLSRATVREQRDWLVRADIKHGAAFRRIIRGSFAAKAGVQTGRAGERLSADSIAPVFKGIAKWINMRPEMVTGVSGHSVKVGATQDLLSFNMDLPSVMQAGRWKSNRMPMRYGEHLLAARGAMARVAELQGRD